MKGWVIDGKDAQKYNETEEGKSIKAALAKMRKPEPPPLPHEHHWTIRYTKHDDRFSEVCRICGASGQFTINQVPIK